MWTLGCVIGSRIIYAQACAQLLTTGFSEGEDFFNKNFSEKSFGRKLLPTSFAADFSSHLANWEFGICTADLVLAL